MTIVVLIPLLALACDLAYAFVKPLKIHRFCGGKGLDPYCSFRGKVPRFGARIMRPAVWKEYR